MAYTPTLDIMTHNYDDCIGGLLLPWLSLQVSCSCVTPGDGTCQGAVEPHTVPESMP